MNGLTKGTLKIFEKISRLDFIEEYTLIDGTALALQINHRLSEDLDFCKWKSSKHRQEKINMAVIEKGLSYVGEIEEKDLLDFNQVDYYVSGVKISFYANNLRTQPVGMKRTKFYNQVYIADLVSIGIMKIELLMRRNKFRDYFDIYSILREGVAYNTLAEGVAKYSNHQLKSKSIAAILANGQNFQKDANFELLNPKYDIEPDSIGHFIAEQIKKDRKERLGF